MNITERKMVNVLKDLRENNHVIGIKAEFEAEGTRMEEALRLKEVCMKAGLGITLKIGGCEAIKDMYESRVIGVERIVAPMIESAYALKKFILATKLVFPDDEKVDLKFAANIETIAGVNAFDKMLNGTQIISPEQIGNLPHPILVTTILHQKEIAKQINFLGLSNSIIYLDE